MEILKQQIELCYDNNIKFNHNELNLYNNFIKKGFKIYKSIEGEILTIEEINLDYIQQKSLICLLKLNIIIIGGAILENDRIQYPKTEDMKNIIDFYNIKGFTVNLEIYDAMDFNNKTPYITRKYKEFDEFEYKNKKVYNFNRKNFEKEDYEIYNKDYNLIFGYHGAASINDFFTVLPENINSTTFLFPMGCRCGEINYFKMIKYLLDDNNIIYNDIYKNNYYDILYLVNNYKEFLKNICHKYSSIVGSINKTDEEKYIFKNFIYIIKNSFTGINGQNIIHYISQTKSILNGFLQDTTQEWFFNQTFINKNLNFKDKNFKSIYDLFYKFKLFFIIYNFYTLNKLGQLRHLKYDSVIEVERIYKLLNYKNKEIDLNNLSYTFITEARKFIIEFKKNNKNIINSNHGGLFEQYNFNDFIKKIIEVYNKLDKKENLDLETIEELISLCEPIVYIY